MEEALRQGLESVSIVRTTGTALHGASVMTRPVRFAILVYDDVEPIDIGATYGVLSMARRVAPEIEMFLVAARAGTVRAANGLVVQADHGYEDCPEADVLLVTGGPGWTQVAGDAATLAFVRGRAGGGKRGPAVASVCTGGMILAAAGLLDGLRATTKREVVGGEASPLGLLGETYPAVEAVAARYVDTGAIVTGGGVTLAIDVTLRLIERLCGRDKAEETARIIEYSAAARANEGRLAAMVIRDAV